MKAGIKSLARYGFLLSFPRALVLLLGIAKFYAARPGKSLLTWTWIEGLSSSCKRVLDWGGKLFKPSMLQ